MKRSRIREALGDRTGVEVAVDAQPEETIHGLLRIVRLRNAPRRRVEIAIEYIPVDAHLLDDPEGMGIHYRGSYNCLRSAVAALETFLHRPVEDILKRGEGTDFERYCRHASGAEFVRELYDAIHQKSFRFPPGAEFRLRNHSSWNVIEKHGHDSAEEALVEQRERQARPGRRGSNRG